MIYYVLDSRYLIDRIVNGRKGLSPSQARFLVGCVIFEILEMAEYVQINGNTTQNSWPDITHEFVGGRVLYDGDTVLTLRESRLRRGVEFLFTVTEFLASEGHVNTASEPRPIIKLEEVDSEEWEDRFDAEGNSKSAASEVRLNSNLQGLAVKVIGEFRAKYRRVEEQREVLEENTSSDEADADFEKLRQRELALYAELIKFHETLTQLFTDNWDYKFGLEFYRTFFRPTLAQVISESGEPLQSRTKRLHANFCKQYPVFFDWLSTEFAKKNVVLLDVVFEAAVSSLQIDPEIDPKTDVNEPSEENREKLFGLFPLRLRVGSINVQFGDFLDHYSYLSKEVILLSCLSIT